MIPCPQWEYVGALYKASCIGVGVFLHRLGWEEVVPRIFYFFLKKNHLKATHLVVWSLCQLFALVAEFHDLLVCLLVFTTVPYTDALPPTRSSLYTDHATISRWFSAIS